VEALLRWRHPTRGLVSPAVFIPVAERFGLIGALGDWVVNQACAQLRAWLDAGHALRVAVNLSVHQLRQEDLDGRVRQALTWHRVDPDLLTMEITETAAMEDAGTTAVTIERLRRMGVHLSIDDFGTGYSSLSYLRRLKAQELKIDRSFVVDLADSVDARAVVQGVINLAHALGLKVVAEGVETREQQAILAAQHCDELQGFFFARPMPAKDLTAWLAAQGAGQHAAQVSLA
jgi:EAL domain-containing protein (putative c-di-GMP-specific phosphodiesterase class I)